jgi:methylenetetrahydrofolate dehydrogenase (NADP+)/methenyltetrahydrofolate cyclohydrolase
MILDGRLLASRMLVNTTEESERLRCIGIIPSLHVILVGHSAPSHIYVNMKKKACHEAAISCTIHTFPETVQAQELQECIEKLNKDPKVHGILVQLPLPIHLFPDEILEYVDPEKDVDGLHPYNLGHLWAGNHYLAPCTPLGCLHLIRHAVDTIEGKHVVIVGRSQLVGKPLAGLLLQENATVTMAHSKTKKLHDVCKSADILVVAIGQPKLIDRSYVKKNAIVIDVGINRLDDGSLVGDTDFEDLEPYVKAITPVPGGVGPITIAYLLHNVIVAASMDD